jgi:tetratricopeptide (TPR) repeat protein
MASVYEDLGQVEAAIEACEKAVETDENNLFALAGLSTLYLDAGRYEDAKSVLRRLIEVSPEEVAAYLKKWGDDDRLNAFRADAYTNHGAACMELFRTLEEEKGVEAASPDLLVEAERSFQRALELEPGHINALYDSAVLYYRENKLGDAAGTVRKLLEVEPGNRKIEEHVRSLLEEQLQERLVERGLLKEIKEADDDPALYRNRTLMTVRNKPLSETVIEGRR